MSDPKENPWQAKGPNVIDDQGRAVAACMFNVAYTREEALEHAQLFAKARELAAMLQRVNEELGRFVRETDGGTQACGRHIFEAAVAIVKEADLLLVDLAKPAGPERQT